MGSDPISRYFGGRSQLGRRIRPRAGTLGPAPGVAASPPLAYKIKVGSSDCSPSRPLRTTTPPESTIRAAFSTVSRSGSGSTRTRAHCTPPDGRGLDEVRFPPPIHSPKTTQEQHMARTRLLAVPVALSVAGTAAMGQSPGRGFSPTGTYTDYALTNVRIVTAPGKVIERGTVVVRDGRIAAVGASVTVPAGVVRMDLAGNSVYPGLIDAATSVGLPSPTRELAAQTVAQAGAAGGGRGGRGGGAAPGGGRGIPLPNGAAAPPAPPIVLPELDADAEAADMFAPTADQLTAFRTAGVTTVGLVFNGGIFPGRVGAALTGSRNDGRLGLRSSAGQEIAFGTKRGGAYPSVGIGSYAFIRQSILDAQYESRLDKAFKAGTPGGRPANDPF